MMGVTYVIIFTDRLYEDSVTSFKSGSSTHVAIFIEDS